MKHSDNRSNAILGNLIEMGILFQSILPLIAWMYKNWLIGDSSLDFHRHRYNKTLMIGNSGTKHCLVEGISIDLSMKQN